MDELKARLEALKSEKITTVSRLEDAWKEAITLAEDAIAFCEKSTAPAPDADFYGDEGIK